MSALRLFDPNPPALGESGLQVDAADVLRQVSQLLQAAGLARPLETAHSAAGPPSAESPAAGTQVLPSGCVSLGATSGQADTRRAWTLRDCYLSDLNRNSASRGKQPREYLRTVERLEAAWGGAGPDLRNLTAEDLTSAFGRVAEWRSFRAWEKNARNVFAMLRASCPQTLTNRKGIPRSQVAPLNFELLPIWELPPASWFRDRGSVAKPKLPLLKTTEFDAVLGACRVTDDPLYWRCLLSFWWCFGLRRDDTLLRLSWLDSSGFGVDLKRSWLLFREQKEGGEINAPVPAWLCEGLRALHDRPRQQLLFEGRRLVFQRTKNQSTYSRWLYVSLKKIFAAAEITPRGPHDLRDVSISYWRQHDVDYACRVTGHSERANIQATHYRITDEEDFRRAAEAHPRPSVSLTE